jgi:uncharacterized coiled-coil protein SlyX
MSEPISSNPDPIPEPTPTPVPEPVAAPTPEPASQPTPSKPQHEPAKAANLGSEVVKPKRKLFGGDNKFGRFLRAVIRVIAAIVGFFALGFLTTYLLLYRPLQVQSRQLATELAQSRQQVEQVQADLDKASLTFLGVQNQNEQLTASVDKLKAQVVVEQTLNKVAEVNLHLAKKDTAAAHLALNQAETLLDGSMTQLETLGAAQSDTIAQLFDLVGNDLDSDANLAQQDLDRLVSELSLISSNLAN